MQLFVGGRYRHYKGNEYTLLALARHSETLEPLVIYQAAYGTHQVWARPLAMFLERVGDQPRFAYLGGGEPVLPCIVET